jgi:hypothetical protein
MFRSADTEPQTKKFSAPQMLGDGIDAFVAVGTTTTLESHTSHGQIELIMQDKDILGGDYAMLAADTRHGLAGKIHKRHGLADQTRRSANNATPELEIPFALQHFKMHALSVRRGGEDLVHNETTEIVPGAFVFRSWIAKSDDEADRIHAFSFLIGAGALL